MGSGAKRERERGRKRFQELVPTTYFICRPYCLKTYGKEYPPPPPPPPPPQRYGPSYSSNKHLIN